MRENNWEDLRQSVLCLTPRRFGKSKFSVNTSYTITRTSNHFIFFLSATAVAMFIAAYAMCVPHRVQSVFSTGRRASQKLLELIKDIVKKTWAADHIVKANQVRLYVTGQKMFFSASDTHSLLYTTGGIDS